MPYSMLFSKGRIGGLELKNRIVMPPMEVGLANFDGTPTEELIAYYAARARGGAGLVIPGITRVNDLHGASHPRQLALSRDRHVAPMGILVDRVHAEGARIFIQLHHPGRQNLSLMVRFWPLMQALGRAWPGFWTRFPGLVPLAQAFYGRVWAPAVVAPSAVPCGHVRQKTRALKRREIHGLVRDFAEGARRAKAAGADGVELHAAHGYLIQQFLSTRTNRRSDEYGGSLENRMRFLLETVAAVRAACGPGFPLVVRLSVDEFYRLAEPATTGAALGIGLAEGVEIARRLEAAGVDAIDVSSASYETMNYWLEPTSFECGWRSGLAAAVKAAVGIPVIAANLVRSPEQAEAQLRAGIQDFVALGRQHIAEPEWAAKAQEGREREARRCVNCLYCFESLNVNAVLGEPFRCALNPLAGRESLEAAIPKDGAGRKAVVVGAGPAGLTAAALLARRGFATVLLERESGPGGQLRLAVRPPKKEKLAWCIEDLESAALRAGARISYGVEASAGLIEAMAPWAVVVATGSLPLRPRLPGTDLAQVLTVTEALGDGFDARGKRIAVIGSGMTGLETAERLAEDGAEVTIVEMATSLGPGAWKQNLDDVMGRLASKEVGFLVGHRLDEVRQGHIVLEEVATGRRVQREADSVVLAVGVRPRDNLARELATRLPRVLVVGDAEKPGRIGDATRSAWDKVLALRA